MKNKNRSKKSILCVAALTALFLASCGKKEDESALLLGKNLDVFTSNINLLSVSINSLDPSNADSSKKLLTYIDSMEKSFNELASLPAPETYPDTRLYTEPAALYMSAAAAELHEVYGSAEYDETLSGSAMEKYYYAFECLDALGNYLEGQPVSLSEAPSLSSNTISSDSVSSD